MHQGKHALILALCVCAISLFMGIAQVHAAPRSLPVSQADGGQKQQAGCNTGTVKFVAHVNPPDGADIVAGTTFTKYWRVQNVGPCEWNSGYSLVFVAGEAMAAPAVVMLGGTVRVGDTVDLSITMTAPDKPGKHFGTWEFRTPDNKPFLGLTDEDKRLIVNINVIGSGTPAATALATPTAGSATPVGASNAEPTVVPTATKAPPTAVPTNTSTSVPPTATDTRLPPTVQPTKPPVVAPATPVPPTPKPQPTATPVVGPLGSLGLTGQLGEVATNVDSIVTQNPAILGVAGALVVALLVLAILGFVAAGRGGKSKKQQRKKGLKPEPKRGRGVVETVAPVATNVAPAPTPAAPVPFLVSESDPKISIGLSKGEMTVGRAQESDLQIGESLPGWETVSRHHARLVKKGDRWMVVDGEADDKPSANGVYVNGIRTRKNFLAEGYQLRFGNVAFLFHAQPSDSTAATITGGTTR